MEASLIVSILALIGSVVGVILSYVTARKYGDLAAVKASRRLHEEDVRKARLAALQSLLNETHRIRHLAQHNAVLSIHNPPHDFVKMPAAAFETAFVSGTPGLTVAQELLDAVSSYLTYASAVNSLVDIYLGALAGDSSRMAGERKRDVEKIAVICSNILPEILERLEAALLAEIRTD